LRRLSSNMLSFKSLYVLRPSVYCVFQYSRVFWNLLCWLDEKHGGCLIRGRHCLPSVSTWVHHRFFCEVRFPCLFNFVLSYYVSFHIKRYSVRIYLQLCVEGSMYYLRYLRLFAYSDLLTHIVLCFCCCFFICLRLVSCCTQCCRYLLVTHSLFSNVYKHRA
jgi:hypothetical protein